MGRIVFDSCAHVLRLSWLTGPVFDKEMRVSSRRRRYYLLRAAYVIIFMLLVALVWHATMPSGSSGLMQSARMAEAGQIIILFVVWFQFIAAQIVAIVMLSTAISDEIYHRTLGLLMTTPVRGFQIVLGKLLSKLLQIVLLLGISLPMLAIVRVFGGVPWSFLVYGLCVTLTTAIFYGSLSLFLSIFTRRAYVVIVQVILTGAVLFGVLPLLGVLLFRRIVPEPVLFGALFYSNPYFGLRYGMHLAALGAPTSFVIWPLHCGIALGCSALLLLLATVFVRRAALHQVTGQSGLLLGRRGNGSVEGTTGGRIRRVIGPPVFWKERRSPLFGRWSVVRIVAVVAAAALLLLVYVLCAREGALNTREAQSAFVVIYLLLGMLITAILPATCITSEKESQAWPILLTTTVSNGAILWGKLLGALRRCLPGWFLLLGHVAVFTLLGYIHPVAIFQFAILVGWITVFLCGTGLYFSTRLRRTTAAVVANVALAAGLWVVLPMLLGLLEVAVAADGDLFELYVDMNPVIHAGTIASATCDKGRLGDYDWLQGGMRSVRGATGWLMFAFVTYVSVSLAFLARAWSRVRRGPL